MMRFKENDLLTVYRGQCIGRPHSTQGANVTHAREEILVDTVASPSFHGPRLYTFFSNRNQPILAS